MEKNTCTTSRERIIELSIGPVDYTGPSTRYTSSLQKTADLLRVFTSYNYSPIIWADNYRCKDNFRSAFGFCPDSDHGLTIDDALHILKAKGLNYALISTRSHTPENHRFRIFLPFSRRVLNSTDYTRIARQILNELFPLTDPSVIDGARQYFASPSNAVYHSNWSGNDYDPDKALERDGKIRVENAWTDSLMVKGKDGSEFRAAAVEKSTPIHCPFHNDASPSAFVDKNPQGNQFIHCSTCGKTYWMEQVVVPIATRFERFYSYQKSVFDVGILGDRFFIDDIGQAKFHILIRAETQEEKDKSFAYLVENKHIRHLQRVDHLGDIACPESYFEYNSGDGIFEVHYRAAQERVKDNAFIDAYLGTTFGAHREFIKEWLAVYSYTNYKKLPTMILIGGRGTGKNTFAEMVMSIFPSLSRVWHGEERNFTPEVEAKLLVADETLAANEKQYRLLKQRSGQKYATVNQKFMPEYQVPNNMNILILSNDPVPIFAEEEEAPVSENNNQFFVFEMPKIHGPLESSFGQKLEERIGWYIRSELKAVFERVKDRSECRYSIPTPITNTEKSLFAMNKTGISHEADIVLQRIVKACSGDMACEQLLPFFVEGLFPASFIDNYYLLGRGYTKQGIIRNLQSRKLLTSEKAQKKQIGGQREYCYEMTGTLITWLEKEKTDGRPAVANYTGKVPAGACNCP
jgi:hypothetical protein